MVDYARMGMGPGRRDYAPVEEKMAAPETTHWLDGSEHEVQLVGRQVYARDAALSGKSVFITGPGGTGKSVVTREIVRALREAGKRVAVTASTGIAAVAVGGMTIHSTLGLGISGNRKDAMEKRGVETVAKAQDRLGGVDTIVLDELSMLTGDYLDMMDWWLGLVKDERAGQHRPFGGFQMILVGDACQLPPVIPDREKVSKQYFFEADAWKAAGLEEIYLRDSHRQADPALFYHLCLLRRGIVSAETVEYFRPCLGRRLEDPTRLYGTNAAAFEENMRRLKALPGAPRTYEASFDGNPKWHGAVADNCVADRELHLKVGAPVIFLKNDPGAGYVNGQRGVVEEMGDGRILVRREDGEGIAVTQHKWEMRDSAERLLAAMVQYPLKLAWAITIHRSQGMSLDRVRVDLAGCFERGQAYVALSRARSMEGLSLDVLPSTVTVRASAKVVNYYRDLASRMKAREEAAREAQGDPP